MRCVNPRRIPNPSPKGVEDAFLNVSCGKCYSCLSNRRRSWLFRLMNESENSSLTLFGTFTIDDDNCDGFVHKQDLQKYFKRLRHFYDFTYYAIGEYGTTTQRPHYHCIFFIKNLIYVDKWKVIEQIQFMWDKGFSSVSRANTKRLNYVLHYHVRPKKINGKDTFQLYSKGLGINFINHDFVNWYRDHDTNIIHDKEGKIFVVPRYYRKKLKDMMIITHRGISTYVDKESGEVYSGFDYDPIFMQVFGKHEYQISDFETSKYLHERIQKDKKRLDKYNNQDKFI